MPKFKRLYVEDKSPADPEESPITVLSQYIADENQQVALVDKNFLLEVLLPAYAGLPQVKLNTIIRHIGKKIVDFGTVSENPTPEEAMEFILVQSVQIDLHRIAQNVYDTHMRNTNNLED